MLFDYMAKNECDLYNQKAHSVLKNVMAILDYFSLLISGKEIVVTDFWREVKPHKKSFHPKFQACDIRINDRDFAWIVDIKEILRFMRSPATSRLCLKKIK